MNLRTCNLLCGLLTIGLGVFVLTGASQLPDRAAAVPDLIAWTLVVLGIVLVALSSFVAGTEPQLATRPFADKPWALIVLVMILLVVYGFTVSSIGFYEMSVVFVAVVSYAMVRKEEGSSARRKAIQSVLYAAAFTVVLYVVFNNLLHVPTPDGLLIS